MAWKKLVKKGEIKSGARTQFVVDGKKIAIFNKDGYHALDAVCVHQDGSIAFGIPFFPVFFSIFALFFFI